MQLPQDPWQRLGRDVKQGGIGEDAVEVGIGQIEPQEILVPDFASTLLACHGNEFSGTVDADGAVAPGGEGGQIPTWAAAQIEDVKGRAAGRIGGDVTQQCVDVLADIMVAGSGTKGLGVGLIVGEGAGGDLFQLRRSKRWAGHG